MDHTVIGLEEITANQLRRDLLRLQPLIEDIATLLDPNVNYREELADLASEEGIRRARDASERLIGRVRDGTLKETAIASAGPSLSRNVLHPVIREASRSLWGNGHYRQAVEEAWLALEDHVQQRIGRTDCSGTHLFQELFPTSLDEVARRPLELRPDERGHDNWVSANKGAHLYGMGCALAIRNIVTHNREPLERERALEYLAALSVLAKWIDEAINNG